MASPPRRRPRARGSDGGRAPSCPARIRHLEAIGAHGIAYVEDPAAPISKVFGVVDRRSIPYGSRATRY